MERTPILTLGLLFGERPIDGRFARLTVPSIFARTDEESERKENEKWQWDSGIGKAGRSQGRRDTTTVRTTSYVQYSA